MFGVIVALLFVLLTRSMLSYSLHVFESATRTRIFPLLIMAVLVRLRIRRYPDEVYNDDALTQPSQHSPFNFDDQSCEFSAREKLQPTAVIYAFS